MKTETELLVIGAGIAGCIVAIALAEEYKVTLIDQSTEPENRIGESLAPAAGRILKQLQLIDHLAPSSYQQLFRKNIGMQSFWGSDQVQIEDYLRNPDGPGLCLDRKAFENHLRKTAVEKGVRCVWPARFISGSFQHSRWNVIIKTKDGKQTYINRHLTAQYVVDATGRQSRFARSQGYNRTSVDKLISCWVSMPDYEENKMSTISAVEFGWWYSAVVPGDKRVLAFQTDSDLIDRIHLRDLRSFLLLARDSVEIQNILRKVRHPIQFHGVVSANSSHLQRVAGNQWIAIGDAAMSFDPLSSQGMYHAMASAMQFKELILKLDVIRNPNPNKLQQLERLYSRQMDRIWKHYLYYRAVYYKAEGRWKNSPFWVRRQEN